MGRLVLRGLHAHHGRAVLDAPGDVGRREGVRRQPVVAVRRRPDQRHHGLGMGQDARGEGPRRLRQPVRISGVEKGVGAAVLVEQAHVDMTAAAGAVGPGLRHEGRSVAELVAELLHRGLEGEGLVGGCQTDRRPEVDLELAGGVLAVMGDQIDALGDQRVHQRLDPLDPVIAGGVEDVQPLEEGLQGLAVEQVEFELVPHLDGKAQRRRLVEQLPQDETRRGLHRAAVVEGQIADHLPHALDPGHRLQRGEVRPELGVGVVDLLVEAGAGHHAGRRIQGQGSAVEVQPALGVVAHLVDGYGLRAAGPVGVRQLEADVLGAPIPQRVDDLGNLLRFGHAAAVPPVALPRHAG